MEIEDVSSSSSSTANGTANRTAKVKKSVLVRRDGTVVESGGSGKLSAQIKATKERRRMDINQQRQETVEEHNAMVTVKFDDGRVEKVDPTTEAGRAALLKYNGISVYRALQKEEADKIPLRVRAAVDRMRIPQEAFLEYYTPQQYRFPPDDDMLRSRHLYCDPSVRMHANAAGFLNYVMHTPMLMAFAEKRKPPMFHILAHEVYSYYMNWMFLLLNAMPGFTESESESVVDKMDDAINAHVINTGSAPLGAPFVRPDVDLDYVLLESIDDLVTAAEARITLYVEIEEKVEGADVAAGDATTFIRYERVPEEQLADVNSLLSKRVFRDVVEHDLEVWAKAVNDANDVLRHDNSNEEALKKRRDSLSKLSRFIYYHLSTNGALPDEMTNGWAEVAKRREETQQALDAKFSELEKTIPIITDELPQYFKDMFDGNTSDALVRIFVNSVGMPPASDWRAASMLTDEEVDAQMEDGGLNDPPEDVAAWMDRFSDFITPKPEIREAYEKKFLVPFTRVHPHIRAYHLLYPEATEIPDWAAEWCAARLDTSAVPAPEWFAKWWQCLHNRPLVAVFPSWMTHQLFRGVNTLSAMAFYYGERAYIDSMQQRLTSQVLPFVSGPEMNVENYFGVARNVTLSMMSLTSLVLKLLEKTIISLVGDSVSPENADYFLSPEAEAITIFHYADDAEKHWREDGGSTVGADYINIQRTEELRLTQTAVVETMKSHMPAEMKIIEDFEAALPAGCGENAITMPKRGQVMMQAIYCAGLNSKTTLYNNLIHDGAQRIIPMLPATHQEEVTKKLIAAYKEIEQNCDYGDAGDIVIETVVETSNMAKKRTRAQGEAQTKRRRK